MPQVTLEMSPEEIKDLIFQLPAKDFLKIAEEIEQRAETVGMMQLAETGFEEWNEAGEDIYDAET
ncbi:MAG: hypothetical protein H7Z16_04695 [Pyrinomonadaceae bacterium]|nr:hypothetical protein [Pyrinomonadaceae bacterium]